MALARKSDDSATIQVGRVTLRVRRTRFGIVATIGPTEAKALLGQNAGNRNLRSTWIDRLARMMVLGQFQLNGEPMLFDVEGNMIDGQHRLHAIVKSGAEIETYVVGDLPTDARDSVGSDIPKTAGDMFGWRGEGDARNLAAVLNTAWRLDTNGHLFSGAGIPWPSKEDLKEYLDNNPAIRDSLHVAGRAQKSIVRYQRKLAGGLHYLMAKKDAEDAAEFRCWRSARCSLRDLSNARHLPGTDRAAVTIKAWNAFRDRKSLKFLRWRRAGDSPEGFPKIR